MRIFTTSPTLKLHRMSIFSRPVLFSRRIQRTCLPVDSQFIIGIVSFHSSGGTYKPFSNSIDRTIGNGSP